jgi:CheY-like chemotaxis protein
MTQADGPPARKVLLVEDEGLVAALLQDMIEDLGHEVFAVAGRFEAASQMVADGAFDFAVLDVNLNGTYTYPLAETLRRRGIPFVFATGYGASALQGEWSGTPVLQKPFQMQDLQHVMREALGGNGRTGG